jgi:hypothetical protein
VVRVSASFNLGEFGLMCAQKIFYWCRQGGNQWSAWDSFLTFFKDVMKLEIDYSKYEHWQTLAERSGPRVVHKHFCMISDRPRVLTVNERNQPHNAEGPFCRWSDGSSLYSLNGIRVPAWVVETPVDQITREDITKESNADTRRELIRKIGNRRLAELLNAKVLDEKDEYQLLSFDIGDGRTRPFIKMTCPSSKLVHILGARPEHTTVESAMAYNFGQRKWRRPMKEDKEFRGGGFMEFDVGQVVGRHGDVLLAKTENQIRADLPLQKSAVLHAGNNHNHMVSGAFYVREDGGKRFLGVVDTATLSHDEHGDQPWGVQEVYGTELEVRIAQEYDHWLEESRAVID